MIFLKMCKQKRQWKASTDVMVALSNKRAVLETGLGYLVRPFSGKHGTLKVNRMHK